MTAGVFAALGIGAPISVCLLTSPSPGNLPLVLLPVAVSVYSAGQLAGQVRGQIAGALRIAFWLYVYAFLGIAGMVQVWTGQFPFMPVADERLDVTTAYVAIIVGLAAFELAGHQQVSRRGPLARYLSGPISTNRLLLLSAVGIACAVVVIAFVGGVDQLFLARQALFAAVVDGATTTFNILPVLGTALRVPLSVAFLGWLVLALTEPGVSRRLAPVVVLAPAVLIVNNPISTPRFTIGTFAIAGILIIFPPINPKRIATFVIGSVMVILLVFPAVDVFRYSTAVPILGEFNAGSPIADLATNPDFDSLEEIAGAVGFVKSQGHTNGRQSLGVALFYVPRGLWADKPDATAAIVADHLALPIRNVSMPLWGFLYMEGGLIVVAVGFYLYGLIVSHLDRIYISCRDQTSAVARLAIPILAGYQFFLLRGDPLPTVGYFAPILACLAIVGAWRRINGFPQDDLASERPRTELIA